MGRVLVSPVTVSGVLVLNEFPTKGLMYFYFMSILSTGESCFIRGRRLNRNWRSGSDSFSYFQAACSRNFCDSPTICSYDLLIYFTWKLSARSFLGVRLLCSIWWLIDSRCRLTSPFTDIYIGCCLLRTHIIRCMCDSG